MRVLLVPEIYRRDDLSTLAEAFDWNIDPSPTRRPLLDDRSRIVVSKSNAAVRVTTPDGVGIRRRDGTTDVTDSLSDDARTVLESASIPAVEKLSGDVPGRDNTSQQSVKERLENLGYK